MRSSFPFNARLIGRSTNRSALSTTSGPPTHRTACFSATRISFDLSIFRLPSNHRATFINLKSESMSVRSESEVQSYASTALSAWMVITSRSGDGNQCEWGQQQTSTSKTASPVHFHDISSVTSRAEFALRSAA